MLIRFGVRNHLSVRDYQELSCVASHALEDLDHLFEMRSESFKDKKFLPVLALYGANAAGKSNLLNAFLFFNQAIIKSYSNWEERKSLPHPHFALDTESKSEASSYECDVMINAVRYQYGFSLNRETVLNEWLYFYPKGARNILFQRSFSPDPKSEVDIYFGPSLRKINDLWRSIAKNTRTLLLSAAGKKDHAHDQLTPIFHYFRDRFQFVHIKEDVNEFFLAEQVQRENIQDRLTTVLKKADFGIVGIEIRKDVVEEKQKNFILGLKSLMKENLGPGVFDDDFDLEDERLRINFVHACSDGSTHTLSYDEESSGTRYLLSLLVPVISALENGKTLIVDEITTNLHTKLSEQIVALFTSKEINTTNAQFIFSTHDTNLLSRELLRRDEIWFTEKSKEGATTVYPLTDFKTRKSDNIEKGYLQGRFGAIPFVGDIGALLS